MNTNKLNLGIDCDKCQETFCSSECFDAHIGSVKALLKLIKQIKREENINVRLVT